MKKILSLALAMGIGLSDLINCNANKLKNYEIKTYSYWTEQCKEATNNYWNGDSSYFCICKDTKRDIEYHTLLHTNRDGHVFILDGGFGGKLDGLTDYLHIKNGTTEFTFIRIKDYPRFKKQFDESDKILEEKTKEFKRYF